jgi:hypothetical protein
MSFLRRIFGGGRPDADAGPAANPPSATELAAEEQARERELLRDEADRTSDELIQRQLRYADRSWTPPAEGGERRADDGGAADGS